MDEKKNLDDLGWVEVFNNLPPIDNNEIDVDYDDDEGLDMRSIAIGQAIGIN